MPPLVKAYIIQVITGFGIAALFVALLLNLDVMGLHTLVKGSPDGVLAVFVLWVLNGLVFGSIQFAIWVMGQADPASPPSGGLRNAAWSTVKVDAKVSPSRNRRPDQT